MPLYEYKCTECEERFELIRKIANRNKSVQCPYCGINITPKLQMPLIARTPKKWEV